MGKTRRKGFGMSLLFSAILLTIIFFAICIRKRNFLAALAAVSALSAAGGAWLTYTANKRQNGCLFSETWNITDCEICSSSSKRKTKAPTVVRTVTPAFEIPIDDEATEEDFTK